MLIAAAVVLIVLAFALPLIVRAGDVPEEEPIPPTQHLDDRKAAIYGNLRDLLGEFQMGKMSERDYRRSKAELQQELAGVLARIDRIERHGNG